MNGQTYTTQCEGCTNKAYQDQNGIWTVGIGCTGQDIGPTTYWPDQTINAVFTQRYAFATAQARADLDADVFDALDEVRQAALVDMAFQMGGAGLDAFHVMLQAVRSANWPTAHDACLASKYGLDTPARCARTASMLLTGQWPAPF